jgi:hypothetical protein
MNPEQQATFPFVKAEGTTLSDQLFAILQSWTGDHCTLDTTRGTFLGKLTYIGADGAIINTMQGTGEISVDGGRAEGLVDTFVPFKAILSLNPTPIAATPTRNYVPGADGWSNATNTPATTGAGKN